MQISYKRIGVIGGFAILLIILVGNGLVMRRQLEVQIDNQRWVSHTRLVLFELKQTEVLLLEAETGKRGYLYTGDTHYLAPFNDAIAQIGPQIDTLARLTADSPLQQARIPWLRDLAIGKIAEMQQTIALYQAGKLDAAKAMVLADTAQLTMVRIGETIDEMEQQESTLDAVREAEYQRSIRRTVASIYLSSLIAVLGLVALAYYILREIGLRERHAQELRAREEWFRVTLTSIGDAVIATDKEGSVTFLNPVAETLTGASLAKAKGRNILEVFPICNELTRKPAENPVQKVMEVGHVVGLANHTVLQRKDGTQIPIEDSAAPIRGDRGELLGVVLVFRDVTSDRKAEDTMRKTERLAAAARLSATMAHEINNPLQAVGSLVYLRQVRAGCAGGRGPAPYPRGPRVEACGAHHAANARVLPRFARYRVCRHAGRGGVGDRSLFQQIKEQGNSRRALLRRLPASARGLGRDQAGYFEPRGQRGRRGRQARALAVTLGNIEDAGRSMLQISIEDDGPGIPPEHIQHIFEPFFTTKQDVGTGLGLWLSKEIVNRYGGTIHLVSGGQGMPGAAFRILLPSAANPPDAMAGGAAND